VVASIPLGSNQITTVRRRRRVAFVLDGLSIEGTLRRYFRRPVLSPSFGGDE
jgi:hypothetical protein